MSHQAPIGLWAGAGGGRAKREAPPFRRNLAELAAQQLRPRPAELAWGKAAGGRRRGAPGHDA